MHWAVVADEDKESGVTEADVMAVYETDPTALRKHHRTVVGITEAEMSTSTMLGYTPAHLLCNMEMTQKNMSLVRQLSMLDPRAFTMKAADGSAEEKGFSALHVACSNPHRTEALLRLLVQLDPSQVKSITRFGGPLGLLCRSLIVSNESQLGCLLEADSSVEVVYDGVVGCCRRPSTSAHRVQTVAKLLEINPAAAQHKGEKGCNLAHQACLYSDRKTPDECVKILKLVLAHHKDALKEANEVGSLPAHHAAEKGPLEVLEFVLVEYPEAATVVDSKSRNLLHRIPRMGPKAKARLLCARYPAMMLQRNGLGCTPLLVSCAFLQGRILRLLCEAGGREAASTAILHPTDAQFGCNGWLPLHVLIRSQVDTLKMQPLSGAADAFRLLLRLYPEAAGIEGGVGAGNVKTPYHLAVTYNLPAYYRRLLLRAAPDLDPAELRRLNWEERRGAMFVAFAAVAKTPSLLVRLRAAENKDLVKHVVSFL